MDIDLIFYTAMEKVTGLSQEDFKDYQDVNLLNSAILDSLSIVGLLKEISAMTGKNLKMDSFSLNDFKDIKTLCSVIKSLLA